MYHCPLTNQVAPVDSMHTRWPLETCLLVSILSLAEPEIVKIAVWRGSSVWDHYRVELACTLIESGQRGDLYYTC